MSPMLHDPAPQRDGPTLSALEPRRACVIGAGAAGLTTAKHLREAGCDVTVFEARDALGGLWYFEAEHVGVGSSTRATSSRAYLEFSDFALPDEADHFVHHSVYLAYLHSYADANGLLPLIRYRHRVEALRREEGRWLVSVSSEEGTVQKRFDLVAVCSGLHQQPRMLDDLPGRSLFGCPVIHSSLLKDVRGMTGKRVMVVGVGESGADLAHELAQASAKCFLALRRGVVVLPRTGGGRPADFDASRAKTWLPRPYLHDFNKRFQQLSGFGFFYTLVELFLLLVLCVVRPSLLGHLRFHFRRLRLPAFWLSPFRRPQRHGLPSGIKLAEFCQSVATSPPMSARERRARVAALYQAFEWFSGASHNSQPFTKSEEFLGDIADGRLTVTPSIVRFVGPKDILLEDGAVVELDCLVLCTGFVSRLPFLEQPELDGRRLFKNVFSVEHQGTLAFIGFARPGIGAMPPLAEMQARWLAAVASGKYRLPDRGEMERQIAADATSYDATRPLHRQRVTSLVDYHVYLDTLAGYLGCRPRLWRLLPRPRLFLTVVFGPFTSHQYRLFGEGRRWEHALRVLTGPYLSSRIGIGLVPQAILFFVFRPIFLLLSWLGFRRFRPLH